MLGVLLAEEALRFEVLADEFDVFGLAAREFEVVQRRLVDREGADGRPLFGGHVGDGRPVGDRQVPHAGAEELDEPIDDADLAELFGDV